MAGTLAQHPIKYRNALFAAMQSESAVLGFPGDGLFTTRAEVVNAGETGFAVYLTVDPAESRPGHDEVQYHFAGAERKSGAGRSGAERGGKLGDLFVLGDFQKQYYCNKSRVDQVDTGWVYVFFFDANHAVVRLHGKPGDYELIGLDRLPRAEGQRSWGGRLRERFGRSGDADDGGGSGFVERLRQRFGKRRETGGTAILWRATQDVVGVLVGLQPVELPGGLTGPRFEYDQPPARQQAIPAGVQVPNPGLLAGGKSVAAAQNGDTYLVGSAPSRVPGVTGQGVLYVGRFGPSGRTRWQRHVGGLRGPDGSRVVAEAPADLLAEGGRLYIATIRRHHGSPGGVAGQTNAARIYALDGSSGRTLAVYDPQFEGGRFGQDPWSAAAGIASDGVGQLYLSGERSAGHSAAPFLMKLRASDLQEIWRMGPFEAGGQDQRPQEIFRGADGGLIERLRNRRADSEPKQKRSEANRGSDRLLKEAWGGVAFWRDPGGVPGEGVAYLSGYRWDDADSPLTAWVAAVSLEGELLWRRELGGDGYEWPWATTTDAAGNVYIGGITTSRRGLHSMGPEPQGAGEGFIAKYSRHGQKLWVRCVTTPDGEEVRDLQVADGVLYATGHTFGRLAPGFDGGEVPRGRSDVWVARYDLEGQRLDAVQLGSRRHERASFEVRHGVIHLGGRTLGSLCRVKDTAGVEPFLVRLNAADLSLAE